MIPLLFTFHTPRQHLHNISPGRSVTLMSRRSCLLENMASEVWNKAAYETLFSRGGGGDGGSGGGEDRK